MSIIKKTMVLLDRIWKKFVLRGDKNMHVHALATLNIKNRDIEIEKLSNIATVQFEFSKNKFHCSEKVYDIFGITQSMRQQDLQNILFTLIYPEHRIRVKSFINSIRTNKTPSRIEFKIFRIDGEVRWIQCKARSSVDISKDHKKIIATIEDITYWKESKIELQNNIKFLQRFIDAIPMPVFFKDSQGIYQYTNAAHRAFVGLEKEKIIGRSIYDLYPTEIADFHSLQDQRVLSKKQKLTYDAKLRSADGYVHNVIFNKSVITNETQDDSGVVGVIMDVTESKKAEQHIRRLLTIKDAMLEVSHGIMKMNNIEELFDSILKKVTKPIEYVDIAGILVADHNKQILKVVACYGCNINIVGNELKIEESFIGVKSKGKIYKPMMINNIQNSVFNDKLKPLTDSGMQSSISAPIIINDELYGMLNIYSKENNIYDELDVEIMDYITNQIAVAVSSHEMYKEIMFLSKYDKLTNVYNNSYFDEMMNQLDLKNIQETYFSFVIFDLNGLKIVNDTYGHLAGDALIEAFARRIKQACRKDTVFARYGGDEFVALVYRSKDEIRDELEKIQNYFKTHPIIFEGQEIICSFSYGISTFPHESRTYKGLFKLADERMYDYKKNMKRKEDKK